MIKKIKKKISLKLGALFSGIFLILLLLLGYILYSLFTHMFIDYITQDLINRGNNHAKVLEDNFNQTTINHVGLMEQKVVTSVIVADHTNRILIHSDPIEKEMELYLDYVGKGSRVLNNNWEKYDYIATVSPIDTGNKGYVYMFYPTEVINDTVLVLKGLIGFASIGFVLIAIVLIGILSKKMTKPLIEMKEATNRMAQGFYKQKVDVTGEDEVAELAQSIKQLGVQLQYYEETRNDFLASVSHELRTPLTYIKGYSDVLAKGFITDEEEKKKYLNIINDETKRVVLLVDDLFELSKMQTGKFELKRENINIISLVKKVTNNLTPLAEKKGLSLSSITEAAVINAYLDPNRIEQVIYNLVENAIKYTDKGRVIVEMKSSDDDVEITIKDTGIGIPEEDLPRIFERFYRVEKSRARKTGGSGLGLFVVKEIIQLHDGSIEVMSKEGIGTTIIIKLKRNDVIT